MQTREDRRQHERWRDDFLECAFVQHDNCIGSRGMKDPDHTRTSNAFLNYRLPCRFVHIFHI